MAFKLMPDHPAYEHANVTPAKIQANIAAQRALQREVLQYYDGHPPSHQVIDLTAPGMGIRVPPSMRNG